MTRKYAPRKIGLDHYARCGATRCMEAAVLYAAKTPMCFAHAVEARADLARMVPLIRTSLRRKTTPHRDRTPQPGRISVVYYGAVDDYIKIGYTASPSNRWRSLAIDHPGFGILVCEPGGVGEEVARQAQFAHLRVAQTEYFRKDPYLMGHIDRLQQLHADWPALVEAAHAAFKAGDPARRKGGVFLPR